MIHLYSDTYLYVTHCLYIYILNMYISISIKCVNNEIMRQFHEILTFLRRK